jgi:hypothetical protein
MYARDTDQARDYCRKARTQVAECVEFGTYKRSVSGSRTDLELFRDAILHPQCDPVELESYLWTHFPHQMARYPRMYQSLRDNVNGVPGATPRVRTNLKVTLLIGDPGTGKTRYAFESFTDAKTGVINGFILPANNGTTWFDGYHGQNHALIDDFSGEVRLNFLLQLLDIYPLKVPVKGGFVWWRPQNVYITTNIHPRLWYNWSNRESQYDALARRFHSIRYFPTGGSRLLGPGSSDPVTDFSTLAGLMGIRF